MAEQDIGTTFSLHPQQGKALLTPATETLFGGQSGGGKGAVLPTRGNAAKMGYDWDVEKEKFLGDTRHDVLTPFGFKPMAEISVGDAVCNPDGTTTQIIATQHNEGQDVYRVIFQDGTSVVVDGPHLWAAKVSGRRTRQKKADPYAGTKEATPEAAFNIDLMRRYKTVTTLELAVLVERANEDEKKQTRPRRVSVPLPNPINSQVSPGRTKMADPYVLGIWIGDGSVTGSTPNYCKPSEAIAEEMRARLAEMGDRLTDRAMEHCYGIAGGNLAACLESLKLSGCLSYQKFIPRQYLGASIETRWLLLQGLMDSDGTASKEGKTYYTTTSPRLRDDFMALARSLGFYASCTTKAEPKYTYKGEIRTGRAAYTVYLTGRDRAQLFLRHERKTSRRCDINTEGGKMVVSVAKIGEGIETKCITVAHPNGLYVSNDYTVTHNSHLMRVAAITWAMQIENLQVYLFRRTYPELIRNHMEGPTSFHEMLAPIVKSGRCRIVEKRIHFDNGAAIHLNHLQHQKNLSDYQGTEIHALCIDELTHFTEEMYVYLRGRCRVAEIDIPDHYRGQFPRILCGSNPGSVGHVWVKKAFVDAGPYTLRRRPDWDGGELRTFIPARLADNPSLALADPNYEKRLEGLKDPALIRALRDGDWSIAAGAMFGERWRASKHTCAPFLIPPDWHIWRGGDDGYAAPSAICWMTQDPKSKRIYVIAELVKKQTLAPDLARQILEIDRSIPLNDMQGGALPNPRQLAGYYDSSAFADIGTGQESRGKQMNALGCRWKPVPKSPTTRVQGVQNMHRLMEVSKDSMDGKANIVFFDTCKYLIETIPALTRDKRNPEDVSSDGEDHGWDCFRYSCQWRGGKSNTIKVSGY